MIIGTGEVALPFALVTVTVNGVPEVVAVGSRCWVEHQSRVELLLDAKLVTTTPPRES